MPNIEQDLQAIMDARYGREVRQSIHDAIRDINNVADNAESVAISSQSSAQNNATKAESYAVGGTSSRTGEDTDNAKYYKEEAERLAGVYAVEDNLTSTSTIHSLSANQGRVLNEKIGAPNGVASLDANGRVPSTQLPSYVDDVLEYASVNNFPATGENGKIYIALDTNKIYRWSGSAYVEISESLALGETSSTAYAGDKGKRNADDIDAIQEVIPSNASTSNKLATMADVGGGGHVLQNQSGTDMPQQPNMQFVDAQLANDATNERTTVEVVKAIPAQRLQSAPDGLYLIPDDGSGAVLDAEDVGFDNTGTNLTATNTEAAIKEVNDKFAHATLFTSYQWLPGGAGQTIQGTYHTLTMNDLKTALNITNATSVIIALQENSAYGNIDYDLNGVISADSTGISYRCGLTQSGTVINIAVIYHM